MEKQQSKKIGAWLIRAVALYLWWFTVVFALAINSEKISWLAQGTHWGDALLRRPYAWDFELMFVVLFIVWGVYLWRASTRITHNLSLLKFTSWAFITHAGILVVIGLLREGELAHLVIDSIFWLLAGLLTLISVKLESHE